MSTQLAQLCICLVKHFYGDLPADIFATLLEKDRLRLNDICVALKLPAKLVKNGLSVLAQQNLLLFHPTNVSGQTFYQPNLAQAYAIVRYGRHVRIVADRLGEHAGAIISTVQTFGSASEEELRSQSMSQHADHGKMNGEPRTNGLAKGDPNQNTEDHAEDVDEASQSKRKHTSRKRRRSQDEDTLEEADKTGSGSSSDDSDSDSELSRVKIAFKTLRSRKYLESLQPYTFLPPTDFDLIVQEHVRKSDSRFRDSISGPKKSELFREAVDLHKTSILDGLARLPKDELDSSEDEKSQPAAKRVKLNGNTAVASARQPDYFRLNPERALIAMRTDVLSMFVHMRLGESFAKVYHRLLRSLEDDKETTGAPYALTTSKKLKYRYGPTTPARSRPLEDEDEDVEEISDLPDKEFGSESTSVVARKLTDTEAALVSKQLSYIYADEGEDDSEESRNVNGTSQKMKQQRVKFERREADVEKCLRIIASSSSIKFVEEVGEEGSNEWTIRIEQLVRSLVQEELERVIEARFGPVGKRIIRILYTKGKLDERALSNTGLIKQRDVRALLTQLQTARYIDIQELPRDNSRQPSRTIYLWYFDQDRCRDAVLGDIYKAMARLLQRHEHERHQVRSTLEKAARTDVQGNESKFLNSAERAALEAWRAKERKIFLALDRHDELVFVLRDLLSPPLAQDPSM